MTDSRNSFGVAATSFGGDKSQVRPESRGRDPETSVPKVKRRRTAVACAACRLRKSRCDGKRPRCSMCGSLGIECVYDASDSSTNAIFSKEHVIEVQSRLHYLEAAVRRHEQVLRTNDMLLPGTDQDINFMSRGPLRTTNEGSSQSYVHDADGLRSADIQESFPENASTDGMVITFISEEDSGYFGQTSNIAFMRHISRAMILNGNHEGLTSPKNSDESALMDNGIVNVSRLPSPKLGSISNTKGPSYHDVTLNTLPSESVTRGLVEKFFSDTGRLFPYIHAPSVWATYEEMKSANFTKVRRTWLGLLNMVLAMASNANCHHDEGQPANERIVQSEKYYQRAMGLCQTQILRGSSLETVQYLLLMSQYLQGTQKSVQTWAIHGLAVKAAMSIGLHSSDASRKFPPIEREYRNRTWFACVLLDRTLSMTFGRPMTIPEDHVQLPLPQPTDHDHMATGVEESSPVEEVRSVAFFNATITLYKIMGRVIAKLYGGNLGCSLSMSRKDMATAIFQFEQEIDEWSHSLPPFLGPLRSSDMSLGQSEGLHWTKYQIILTLRLLNLQVLLYRPVLLKSIDRTVEAANYSTTMRSMDQMEKTHIDSCLASAKEIIDMVHMIVTTPGTGKRLLGAWWFSLYYVFNSALMIFGSLLTHSKYVNSPASSDQVDACRGSLARAIEALRLLDRGNVTVERCALFIEEMAQKINALNGTVSGIPGQMTRAYAVVSETEKGVDHSCTAGIQSPRHQPTGPTDFMTQTHAPLATDFLLGAGFADELELSQFFLGSGMDFWVNNES